VNEANAGFVYTPEEFNAALASIEKLLADADSRREYGENARRYADARLSTSALVPRYEELFEHVIAGGAK